jgi:ADP-ribosylglycohydrolase
VEGFELWWQRDGRKFAPYTDDTQMAEIVLRALITGRESQLDSVMSEMAAGFVEWRINPQGGHRAPGNACLAGAARLSEGVHWSMAGGDTAGGCGSVMRAYPFGVVFMNDPEKAERWAAEHSRLTHRDPIALAACGAMAIGTALALQGEGPDAILDAMPVAANRYSQSTAEMIRDAIAEARHHADPLDVLGRLHGWAAHEAIAAAAFVFARHPTDPYAAILEGANAEGDSDSIATLAGALVGANAGIGAIPSGWVQNVERSDELLALAEQAASFGPR